MIIKRRKRKPFVPNKGLQGDNRELLDDLFERIIWFFNDQWKVGVEIEIDKIEYNELSLVSFFTVSGKDKRQKCLLKISKITNSESKIKNELSALQLLYPVFRENITCQVPKPLVAFPDKSAIVIESYSFSSLHLEMGYLKFFSSTSALRDLTEKFKLMGKWLRQLHGLSLEEKYDADYLESLVAFCNDRLNKMVVKGFSFVPGSFRDRVLGCLQKNIDLLEKKAFLTTYVHGDFGPWNVLSAPNRIMVIDYSTFGKGPICQDFLKVICSLRDQRLNPFQSNKRVRSLERAFRYGFGPLPVVPEEILNICEIQIRLVKLFSALFPSPNWKAKIEQRRVIRTQLAWFLRDDMQSSLWNE